MNRLTYLAAAIAVALAAGFVVTRDGADTVADGSSAVNKGSGRALAKVSVPASLSDIAVIGKRGFDAKCAACHGENAAGIDGAGPPLVHKIYEPSHHGDASFWLATQNGVRAHHWKFGNMPAVDGLTRADVSAIVAYVRELQNENGIF